jgi:alpha-galactosidase
VVAERITVGLIPKVVRELDDLQSSTGMSKTDIVNRAVSLYRFLAEQLEHGEEIRLYNPDTKVSQRVHLI